MQQAAAISIDHHSRSGPSYDGWLERIRERFSLLGNVPLFTTDADPELLWVAYQNGFATDQRQFHNCSACRHFIRRFGGLVMLDENGRTESVIWSGDDCPSEYAESVRGMLAIIRRAKVTGVFLSSDPIWGTPITGPWTHFAVVPHRDAIHRSKIKTAGQAMAEKREDHKNVMRALQEFSPALIAQALSLLNSDALFRSEKVIGPAQWLSDLHAACAKSNRSNAVWRAVATAPAGFCHPRASMIGTLLEDLESGMDFSAVSKRLRDKMHPLQYQRPQAAPSVGTIAQAEKLVKQMGIARSLERRFARLDEIQTIWMPAEQPKAQGGGVFAHLKAKEDQSRTALVVPPQAITFEKFVAKVLPIAKSIDVMAPHVGNYCGILTAEHIDAPPILQWDTEAQRNPFSWYLYHGGSTADAWGIRSGWVKSTALTLKPSMWFGGSKHHGTGAVFILEGARDSRAPSVCLFPEILKSELHSVRSVIEAHSRTAKAGGYDRASACGIILFDKNSSAHVRVTDATATQIQYNIDRWD